MVAHRTTTRYDQLRMDIFMKRSLTALSITAVTLTALPAMAFAVSPTKSTTSKTSTSLIISEYVEGSSTNKAVEIYNTTAAEISLDDVVVEAYFNGSTTATALKLSGTLGAGKTFVVGSAPDGSALVDKLDQRETRGLWNGDDALVLKRAGVVLDSLGQVGVDPGTAWSAGGVSTKDQTLTKTGCSVDTTPDDEFSPNTAWAALGKDIFSGLGAHGCGSEPTPTGTPTTDPTSTPTSTPTGSPTNTPTTTSTSAPTTGPDECGGTATGIPAVQGAGGTSPLAGQNVTVEGTVIGDFQQGGFKGYFIQDGGDGNTATSDGVFVYTPNGKDVALGDVVRVSGEVSEAFGMTQLTPTKVITCGTNALPTPVQVSLPLPAGKTWEQLEGMRVQLPDNMHVIEYFNFDRFGEAVLATKPQYQPTNLYAPGSGQAKSLATQNLANRITVDDGRSAQNPDPSRHLNGKEFTLTNRFRGGDTISGLTGVVDYRFKKFRIQPVGTAEHVVKNAHPSNVPTVGGSLKVASFNVLNYFTTFGERGADNQAEFDRQETKIVAALAKLDADVVGLMELENNPAALARLTEALNAKVGAGTYAAITTGKVGSDAITQGLIYKPATVKPRGKFALLTSTVDSDFVDTKNRPAIAQTFTDKKTRKDFTVAVNHLKSKGSSCEDLGDPLDPDGQGNCNQIRTKAAKALARWMDSNPTKSRSNYRLILGDLNAYAMEDPITALKSAEYVDLINSFGGSKAYSYVFNGQRGYLDHALANAALKPFVTGAADWHINADEPDLLNYDTSFKKPAQQALFEANEFRSSDHDPVVIGLSLADSTADTTPPVLKARSWNRKIKARGGRFRTITVKARAKDAVDGRIPAKVVKVEANKPSCTVSMRSTKKARIKAKAGCVYSFTFRAKDKSGNVAEKTMTITVVRRPRNDCPIFF